MKTFSKPVLEIVTEHNQTHVIITLHSNIPSSRKTGEVFSALTIRTVTPPDNESDIQHPLCCRDCQHRYTASLSLSVEEAMTLANGTLRTIGDTK